MKRLETVVIEYRGAFPALQAAVLAALESGARVVLSLDSLQALDIETMRALIRLLRRCRALGGEVSLQASNPEVRRTLAVTALDRLFPIYDPGAAA
ncbi:MAG TPA: STAS domain-containing protein [Verrucomicrobiae bacterium]|nr:STAS domain-containing protein [Verrucomicrobiae bacterium]